MSKILIIEDDNKIRTILKEILEEKDHEVDEAGDGQDGLKKLESGSYDLCLCDIKMPKMDGMEVLQKAKEAGIGTNFIIISAHGTIDIAVEAVKKGAFDFLQKPIRYQDLLDRIQRAIVKHQKLHKSLGEHERIRSLLEQLTPREREVLDLMTQGKQNKAIAQVLDVSPRTIEIHRARVMEKMNAHSVAELVRMTLDQGERQPAGQ